MRKILLILTVLTTTLTHGQVDFDKFDELVISDIGNILGRSFSGHRYLIQLKESPLKLYGTEVLRGADLLERLKTQDFDRYQKIKSLFEDSIQRAGEEIERLKSEFKPESKLLGNIDKGVIQNLVDQLVPFKRTDILKELMITKDSINRNLENYIIRFLKRKKIKYKRDGFNYCKGKLGDFKLFEKTAAAMTKGSGTDDYRTVAIELRNKMDTVMFYTHGQYPFMLPWFDETGKEFSYNPNLSKKVGQLLPDYEGSNRNALLVENESYRDFYITELYFRTIENNCLTKKNKLMTP